MNILEFQPFPKMARLNREIIITEKIDGTNAQIFILPRVDTTQGDLDIAKEPFIEVGDYVMLAGSRNRWLSIDNDNYGFAHWVSENRDELLKLGPGRHFGEWWGNGIQRRYGMAEKVFSLFNASRWLLDTDCEDGALLGEKLRERPPTCCRVVPVLHTGPFSTVSIAITLEALRANGSAAAPGFMAPEGIVVFHVAAGTCFKVTLENDDKPKGVACAD